MESGAGERQRLWKRGLRRATLSAFQTSQLRTFDTASAKSRGFSCGRLCPASTVRCSCAATNRGASLFVPPGLRGSCVPSRVTAGIAIAGAGPGDLRAAAAQGRRLPGRRHGGSNGAGCDHPGSRIGEDRGDFVEGVNVVGKSVRQDHGPAAVGAPFRVRDAQRPSLDASRRPLIHERLSTPWR